MRAGLVKMVLMGRSPVNGINRVDEYWRVGMQEIRD